MIEYFERLKVKGWNTEVDSIILPNDVISLISELEAAGFEAYAVGGCIRDILRRKSPDDYDLTTSAHPDEVKRVFSHLTVIPTGEKHGTVTVIQNGKPYEITTYRTEGNYSDKRRPDSIEFSKSIEDDLSRRDLTINAIAYSPTRGFCDPFFGAEDISKKIIRAVGDPQKRFDEDALRILRAVRFSSTLGFEIEQSTERALYAKKSGLREISAERIYVELKKLLCGKSAGKTLTKYVGILGEIIPELLPMEGFDQKNKYHKYTVLEHTARVLDGVPAVPHLRLAALFHDIAKPACFFEDKYGGHFHGHEKVSAEMAHDIMCRLKSDKDTRQKVTSLVLNHGLVLQKDEPFIKRCLNRFGKEMFRDLILLSLSDNSALSELCADRPQKIREVSELTENIISSQPCLSLSELNIKGGDLISLGIPAGPKVGEILKALLSKVINGECENTFPALTAEAKLLL